MSAACIASSQLTAPMPKTTDDCNQNLRQVCRRMFAVNVVVSSHNTFVTFCLHFPARLHTFVYVLYLQVAVV